MNSSLRSLRISVISALNISRDYSYAENTEIRRDRRENFKSRQGLLFVQSHLILAQSRKALRLETASLRLCVLARELVL
jgi:hypothetical protein